MTEHEVLSTSTHKVLGEDDAKQILVQLEDGSTWKAKYEGGAVVLIEQLSDPTGSSRDATEDSSEATDSESESEAEPEPAEAEGTPEPSETEEAEPSEEEGDPYEDIFEHNGYGASDYEDMFKHIPNANGLPDHLKDKIKDPAFRARLSSIMLDNKYDRKLRGRTRGKLDMGRLPKVPMMQRNVFVKKQSRKGKSYNVLVLVDQSGSMHGAKARQAAESTVFLINSLEGININTAVIGFNGAISILKPWGSKPNYDQLYDFIFGCGRAEPWDKHNDSGENFDYDAMHYGYEYFNKAGDGENILLMLSDGEPAHGRGDPKIQDEKGNLIGGFKFHRHHGTYYERWEAPALHHLVKSYPNVSSVGVGILEGGWQIPEHEVIHNLDDLKKTVIKLVGKKIKRG